MDAKEDYTWKALKVTKISFRNIARQKQVKRVTSLWVVFDITLKNEEKKKF